MRRHVLVSKTRWNDCSVYRKGFIYIYTHLYMYIEVVATCKKFADASEEVFARFDSVPPVHAQFWPNLFSRSSLIPWGHWNFMDLTNFTCCYIIFHAFRLKIFAVFSITSSSVSWTKSPRLTFAILRSSFLLALPSSQILLSFRNTTLRASCRRDASHQRWDVLVAPSVRFHPMMHLQPYACVYVSPSMRQIFANATTFAPLAREKSLECAYIIFVLRHLSSGSSFSHLFRRTFAFTWTYVYTWIYGCTVYCIRVKIQEGTSERPSLFTYLLECWARVRVCHALCSFPRHSSFALQTHSGRLEKNEKEKGKLHFTPHRSHGTW